MTVKGGHMTDEQRARMREGQSKVPLAIRRSRARMGAAAIHTAGKTNTVAAGRASMARFVTIEERVAYMRDLAGRAAVVRRHLAKVRREAVA
jgi:hypothetical protein